MSAPPASVDIGQPATSPPGADQPSATVPAEPATEQPATEPAGSAAAPVAPEALQFTAPAVGGGEIDAASFAGKPTVFWFWAPT